MATRGWQNVTESDVRAKMKPKTVMVYPATAVAVKAKPSKYRAKRTVVDGITFDSAKEAKRYGELRLLEKARAIQQLRVHVAFGLHVGIGPLTLIGEYEADFVYEERVGEDWCARIEDVKGFKTPLYRWKKKHFEAQYGIQIRET